MTTKFWYDDYTVLFDKYYIFDFIPEKGQSLSANLNAIARFLIYLSLILFVISYGDINYLGIAIIGLIATYIIYIAIEYKEGMTTSNSYTEPTQDNPFMNVLINEYVENPNRPPARPTEQVPDEIDKYFNHNLYKDVDDVWGKANSQRQYYTTPNTTIPNDRASFLKWLNQGNEYVCKDGDAHMCGKHETIHINKHGEGLFN